MKDYFEQTLQFRYQKKRKAITVVSLGLLVSELFCHPSGEDFRPYVPTDEDISWVF